MSGSLKLGLTIILLVVAVGIAIQLLKFVLHTVISLIIPVAVIAGIGYVLYSIYGKKSIGGGGRRYLP
jgi:hypothetical protein